MILAGVVLGAVYGALLARRRDGSRLDMAHYAAGYAIVLGLIAVLVRIGIDRFGA